MLHCRNVRDRAERGSAKSGVKLVTSAQICDSMFISTHKDRAVKVDGGSRYGKIWCQWQVKLDSDVFYTQKSHSKGYFIKSYLLGMLPGGHLITSCPLKGHLRGHFGIFCLLEKLYPLEGEYQGF